MSLGESPLTISEGKEIRGDDWQTVKARDENGAQYRSAEAGEQRREQRERPQYRGSGSEAAKCWWGREQRVGTLPSVVSDQQGSKGSRVHPNLLISYCATAHICGLFNVRHTTICISPSHTNLLVTASCMCRHVGRKACRFQLELHQSGWLYCTAALGTTTSSADPYVNFHLPPLCRGDALLDDPSLPLLPPPLFASDHYAALYACFPKRTL
jgi:hypothetical protein